MRSPDELYRLLARHLHPDKGGDDELFAALKELYEQAKSAPAVNKVGPSVTIIQEIFRGRK